MRSRCTALRLAAILAATALLSIPTGEATAQEGRGYLDVRATYFPDSDGETLQLVEQVRPTFVQPLGEGFKIVTTIDLTLAEGRSQAEELQRTLEESDFGPLLEQAGCTWPATQNSFLHVDDAADYLEVSRLYLDYYSPRLDVRAGRQALHWGSAQFFNPTDPFPELLIAEPWRPRRGVNALRTHVPLSARTDATAVVALDESLAEPRAALRLRTRRWGADLALTGAWRGDSNWLAGLDLRGTLGVGYWIEAAVVGADGDAHEELAAGIDYTFHLFEKLVALAQYYRNGSGETAKERYRRDAALTAGGPTCRGGSPLGTDACADEFAPATLARDYLLVSLSAQLTIEISAAIPLLQNLNDGTAVVLPTVTWDALEWLEFSLAGRIPFRTWGDGGEFKPGAGDLVIERDFGADGTARADLSGIVPAATITLWTRISF